jgi:hypothetical protein
LDSEITSSDAPKDELPMPAEPVTVQEPKNCVSQLTTSELARYRRELEHALKTLPEHAPVRATLRRKLDEVLAEQADRARLANARP